MIMENPILSISIFLVTALTFVHSGEQVRIPALPDLEYLQTDTAALPSCVKALNHGGIRGIRSFAGARRYVKTFFLPNGEKTYLFQSSASIGCNRNEPASMKYYSGSCLLIASFPQNFSMNKGFRPLVAPGYMPADFPEARAGEYPQYFALLLDRKDENVIKSSARPVDPFPVQKRYIINNISENILNAKPGDFFTISTKQGLIHSRAKKILTSYKLVPQLTTILTEAQCKVPPCFKIERKILVYYNEHLHRFIDIRNNSLMISQAKFENANTPTQAVPIAWKKAYGINAK